MRRTPAVVVALTLLLAACSSGGAAEVPEGFQEVSHPGATVAVPESWTEGDPGDLAEADPDIVDMRVPDAPEGQPFGMRLWQYGRTEERTFSNAEEPAGLQAALLPADREQLRREDVEIPGAAEGFLLQLQAQGSLMDDPVRFTYVVALEEQGGPAWLLSLVGTEEQIPDDVIDQVVSTFRLTEPA